MDLQPWTFFLLINIRYIESDFNFICTGKGATGIHKWVAPIAHIYIFPSNVSCVLQRRHHGTRKSKGMVPLFIIIIIIIIANPEFLEILINSYSDQLS